MDLEKIYKIKQETNNILNEEKDKKSFERKQLGDAVQRHQDAKREKENREKLIMRIRANRSAILSLNNVNNSIHAAYPLINI